MNIKDFIYNQITYGIYLTPDVHIKKNIQKVNTITFGICIYIIFLCKINIAEHNYKLVIVGLCDGILLLINHLLFRIIKRVKLYFIIFTAIQMAAIIETLISGAYYGASLLLLGLGILSIMNTTGIKYGSILVAVLFSVELFIFKYHSIFSWLYTYPDDLERLFLRFFATQFGIYIVATFSIKKELDLYAQLTKEKEYRKQLFINVIHDLKTPLTIIKNSTEELINNSKIRNSKELLISNIQSMEKNIISILNLERLEKGQIVLDKSATTNISELTINICGFLKTYSLSRNIEMKMNVQKDVFINIDKTSFCNILNNLIDNAIKFTDTGGNISVTLSKSNAQACLKVIDTGIGIPKSEIGKIFESYYQIDYSFESHYGLGIGLAFTKELCNAWGGIISIDSTVGVGTCFTVTFPQVDGICQNPGHNYVKHIEPNATYFNEPEIMPYNKNLETILIVEDNKDIRALLITSFKHTYNLIVCSNGEEALEKYTSNKKIDLVITDLMMPVMDGKEFIKRLRLVDKRLITPVVVLTALSEDDTAYEYLSLGAIDFINKPFSMRDLKGKVESILTIFKNRKENYTEKIGNDLINFISDNLTSKKNSDQINHEMLREYSISKKEQEIIEQIANGLCYKEIAYNNNISINTVKTYISRIYKKCNINNNNSLLKLFYSIDFV